MCEGVDKWINKEYIIWNKTNKDKQGTQLKSK